MTDQEIKIIGPAKVTSVVQQTSHLPREGEEPEEEYKEDSLLTFFNKKSIKHLEDEADQIAKKLNGLVTRFANVVADKGKLDEITIGLAVSIEGDIGLASAGAEATIELKFKIN